MWRTGIVADGQRRLIQRPVRHFRPGVAAAKTAVGTIDRIGLTGTRLNVIEADGRRHDVGVAGLERATDHEGAAAGLIEWLDTRFARRSVAAVGHRVVHGGARHGDPQPVTPELLDELRRLVPFDPDHLPGEIALIEAFRRHDPDLPQVACFDTAFHHDLPRVARIAADPPAVRGRGGPPLRLPRPVVRLPAWRSWPGSPARRSPGARVSSPTSAPGRAWRRSATAGASTRPWASRRPPGWSWGRAPATSTPGLSVVPVPVRRG